MTNHLVNKIGQSIPAFINTLKIHLPTIENEVNSLIKRKSKNRRTIERRLETLLSLNMHGIADDLFSQLLEYYKTINFEDIPSGVHCISMHHC